MYTAKKNRQIESFNLMHEDQKRRYEALMNNPMIKVLDKRIEKHNISTQSSFGDKESNDYTVYIIEWEEITL